MVEASLPAVATLIPVAEVLAGFLRTRDAAESVQVCTTLAKPMFRNRCTAAAREAERNNDMRRYRLNGGLIVAHGGRRGGDSAPLRASLMADWNS